LTVIAQLHRCSPLRARSALHAPAIVESPMVSKASPPPDRRAIEALAYRYWQERGCPHGSPEVDWFRAERFLSGAAARQS